MKTTLAIIPARAGSKRIPGKNKRLFVGKPLIYWTIKAAIEASDISEVVVSTDDDEILNFQSLFPSVRFYKRPESLAQDFSSSAEVILDVMEKYDRPLEKIILLQPTSPLRGADSIQSALRQYSEDNCKQLVSVRSCHEVPSHIMKENQGYIIPLLDKHTQLRSQDWERLWVLNGAIYISEWNFFLDRKTFLTESTKAFVMLDSVSVDIDTEDDWKRAETFAKDVLWK